MNGLTTPDGFPVGDLPALGDDAGRWDKPDFAEFMASAGIAGVLACFLIAMLYALLG